MERYKEKIPLDTCVVKSIVKSIENADYLYQNYLQEENLLDDENHSDKNSIESSSKNIKNAKKLKVN